jgi:NAD(P)-dependent dehydrogenase (short-subunit alcohol dehydrogenase family)
MEGTIRTALITGASRGLGLALARRLAQDGWQLLLDARDEVALGEAARQLAGAAAVRAVAGDVTDPGHRAALARAATDLGGLDAVVNNASTLGPSPLPRLRDLPLLEMAQLIRVNAVSPLAVIQDLRDALKPGVRILNVTSDAAIEAYPGWGGYGASKAALELWTRVLAEEEPEWRVYVVDPGDMRTAMHQAAFPGEDISDRPLPDASVPGFVRLLTGNLPSGRYRAREVA